MKCFNKRILLEILPIILLVNLLYPLVSAAGQNGIKTPAVTILDNFFLVRPPAFLELADKIMPAKTAAIIFPLDVFSTIKEGDTFSIITKSSAIVTGTVNKFINPCPSEMNTDAAACGELLLEKNIVWGKGYYDDAVSSSLLAVKGKALSNNNVGSFEPLQKNAVKQYEPAMKKYMKGYTYSFGEAVRIVPPHSRKTYDFISLDYFKSEEYATLGDKAIEHTSFLFAVDNKKATLLLHDNALQRIIALTDVNGDGIDEVLVFVSSDIYEGTYEMRLFDGTKFIGESRELYTWID